MTEAPKHHSLIFIRTSSLPIGAPFRRQAGECAVKLIRQPEFNFDDNVIQPGESYGGAPVLRADIDENGDLSNVELASGSGFGD